METEVLKCNLTKAKSTWQNIIMWMKTVKWIKFLNILINCECNKDKNTCKRKNLNEFPD